MPKGSRPKPSGHPQTPLLKIKLPQQAEQTEELMHSKQKAGQRTHVDNGEQE